MWEIITEPFSYPLEPAKRIYWVCLFSALILASIAVTLRSGRFEWRSQIRALFSISYWLRRSTAEDIGWMFVNNAIRGFVLVPLIGTHIVATLMIGRFLQQHVGDAPELYFSPWFIAFAFTIVFFVMEDLSRFLLHLGMHRSRALWYFHRVHHSATNLTPLTLFRVHPVESVLYFVRSFTVFGLVSGVFVWLFGSQLSGWDILGVDLFGFLFNALGANLRHTPVWLTFGYLERWFISPVQHQLHHSVKHGHCNLGACLSVWDRVYGTHQRSGTYRTLRFGLDSESVKSAVPAVRTA